MNAETTKERDLRMMRLALDEAQKAISHEDVPVGAVLVDDSTNEIITLSHNTREMCQTALGHAEMSAIKEACEKRHSWRLSNCTLYVTLEPCPMCAGAIIAARIPRVVFGAKDAVAGAMGSVWAIHRHPDQNSSVVVEEGLLEEESKTLLRDFFKSKRKS